MSEYKIVRPKKGVIGIEGIGYIENTTASCDILQIIETLQSELDKLKADYATIQKENAKLRECVEFYADRKNWNYDYFNGHDDYNDSEMEACGKKARETLKELRSNDEPLGSELEGGE